MKSLLRPQLLLSASATAALLLSGCYADSEATYGQTDAELAGAPAGTVIPNRYIVVFHDDAVSAAAADENYGQRQARARSAAASVLADHGLPAAAAERVYGTALRGFAAQLSAADASRLANDPRVKYVEPDQVVTLLAPPCHVTNTCDDDGGGSSQTVPYGITRVGGGSSSGSGTAWVIDTGVDFDHEDLNVDVARSAGFVRNGNGDDGNGHGTHVAGTIAALDNNVGVVGVAPGAPVVAVQVLSKSGSGTTAGVIDGVNYVAANASNGDVANMSLGGGVSQALDDAVIGCAQSGVKIALAAGNESDDADNHSPARANHANIFTVSAIDSNDQFASFSNFGNPPVDFAAPGVSVLSTYKSGGYATLSGTSMAAPHVAGLLLLGNVRSDGNAIGDPDGNPDPIASN